MSFTSLLFKAARLSADGRSVRRNRVPERAANKLVGRVAGRGLRRLWR
jgi:hypothetical protein